MSADNTTQSSDVAIKTKTATLADKYYKFIQFGYYMMSHISNMENFNREEYMEKIKMFATVEEQQTFVQHFLDNQKQIKKDIAILKKNKNKKPETEKPKRQREAKPKTSKTHTPSNSSITNVSSDETQENLIEAITNELTEEPMINQLNSANEVDKEATTVKKPTEEPKRKTKSKTTNNPKQSDTNSAVAGGETPENRNEPVTNMLTNEPMINQIKSAIEVAKELTAKKPRVVKKSNNTNTKQTDVDQLASDLAAVAM